MAEIEFVKKIDDKIQIKTIFISCTNKEGLVSNKRKDGSLMQGVPENGLIGFLKEKNSSLKIISTGGTYNLIKEAGIEVTEISKYTGFPEMKTGLVKSLHPKIHAGLLAHQYTSSDDEFMKEQGIEYIDALIVNFYALDEAVKKTNNFEIIRQSIDVGGPSMSHNARKAFISTALITDPEDYKELVEETEKNNGKVSLKTRLKLVKKASTMINEYMDSVNNVIQNIKYEELTECYEVQNE